MAARKGFGGVGGFGYHQMPVNQPMTEAEMNISTNTSSTNLKDKRSRIFIGNLNTFRVTKADVEEIFSYYGYIKGCSVHKGYAFVQYTNEADARAAATSEDGRMLAGQVLDVNIASEPKPNQKPPGQGPTKRGAPSTNWGSGVGMDFQSDPNYTGFDQPPPLMGGPPAKRPRPGMMGKPKMGTQNRPKALATVAAAASVMPSISGSTDILICGMCKQVFSNMAVLQAHKTQGCQLKFVCKCSELAGELTGPAKPSSWVCIMCPETFEGAWPLMYHAQTQHGTSIFQDNPEIKEEEEELKDEESVQNSQNGNGEEEQQQAAIEEQN